MFKPIKDLFEAKWNAKVYKNCYEEAHAREFWYRKAVLSMFIDDLIDWKFYKEINERYKNLMSEHESGKRA